MTNKNFCPYCAAITLQNASHCKNCGAKLESVIDQDLPKQTTLLNGRFKIQHTIGRGGFGIAYLAQEVKTNQQVVVKELFPDQLVMRTANRNVVAIKGAELEFQQSLKHSEREATIAGQLKHPSAPRIIETWRENGTSYTAMEYIRGQTLEQRLLERTLSELEVIDCLTQILEVLQELHEKGLLHRDIKPANIILGVSRVELIDFGSVTSFQKGERVKLTTRLVTPEYAPLEQFASETELSPATDLYALGATMFEAMTGKPPPAALERANGAKLPSIQGFSAGTAWLLTGLIEKMLEMKVVNRPKSASDVLGLLKSLERHAVQAKTPSVITAVTPQLQLSKTRARQNWLVTWGWLPLLSVALLIFFRLFYFENFEKSKQTGLQNVQDQPIVKTDTYILSDIRVYLIPVWVEDQEKPKIAILMNFLDESNNPFLRYGSGNYHFDQSYSGQVVGGFAKDISEIHVRNSAVRSDWEVFIKDIPLQLGQYVFVAYINKDNPGERKLIRKDFSLNSRFTKLEPLRNIQGRYIPRANSIELIWNAPIGARSYFGNSGFGVYATYVLEDPRLVTGAVILEHGSYDIISMNHSDGFLEKNIDSTQIAFSQTKICQSNLAQMKANPNVFLPMNTRKCL
jgi:serine/threonine protein kinase